MIVTRPAGFFNLRDVGGHASSDGRSVRRGVVYRADAPRPSDGRGHDVIRGFGTRTLLDLRSDRERDAVGDLPDDLQRVMQAVPMVDDVASEPDDWRSPARAAAIYFDMLAEGQDNVARALNVLTDPAAFPAIFFCTAGKDRTGIVAALLLAALGVSDDVIVADYAASTDGAIRLLEWYQAKQPEAFAELETFVPVFSAYADTMLAFLKLLRAELGSPAAYVTSIGVDVPQLRDALLT